MASIGQFLLGFMMALGLVVFLPLYLIDQETKKREEREKQNFKE